MGDESFPPSPAADQKGTRPTHFAAVLAPPCSLRFSLWAAKIIFRHSLFAPPARLLPTGPAIPDFQPRPLACEHMLNFPAITLHKNGAVCRGYYCDVRGGNIRACEKMIAGLHLRASLGFLHDKSTTLAPDWIFVVSRSPCCCHRYRTPVQFAHSMKSLIRIFAVAACVVAASALVAAERQPVNRAVGENKATPPSRIKAMKDFRVELLYSVPGGEQGSWVALCTDPKGRIIVADQYGGLYRFTPPAANQPLDPAKVEKMPTEIRAVNGMLWAFGALYVGVNDYEKKIPSGVYRISSSKNDDTLDKVELLRAIKAGGDHGVHAILPAPDGKNLFLITGNNSDLTDCDTSRVPRVWGEDHVLFRMPDGRGHNRDRLAPGGIIYQFSPDGKHFEVYSTGFRNIFDAGFNRDGELFTYDADMEYDFNTSWYRPTRISHVTSGGEHGWRNG